MAPPSWIELLTGRKAWIIMALFGAVLIGFQYYLLFSRVAPAPATANIPPPPNPLPDFKLTERNGKSVGKQDLLGQPWIANFIFTSCPGPCLDMTRAMKRLQDEVLPSFPGVKLVSFSIDPETDTPAVLGAFAEKYQADPSKWLFLTGPAGDIQDLCLQGFHLAFAEAADEERPKVGRFTHSSKFAIVDAGGHVRAYVDGLASETPEIVKARLLALPQP